VPQPGNQPPPGVAQGGKAFEALSNHAFQEQLSITGSATAGTMYGALGVPFVPKVSGKVLCIWSTTGTGVNATGGATFTPNVGSFTGPVMSAQVGGGTAGGGTIQAMGCFIATGLTVGSPARLNVAYASASGYTPDATGQGSILAIELPG